MSEIKQFIDFPNVNIYISELKQLLVMIYWWVIFHILI